MGPGVDPTRIGERVWIWNGQWQRPFGTAAQAITLPADQAVPLPDGVPFEVGACLGIPATTGHATVYGDGPVDGQTILVTGGAGSVGRYAVQMAKLGGATVIATVSNAEKGRIAAEAGADHVVNYRDADVAEAVMDLTGGAGIDRIVEVEFGVNASTSAAVIKPNGVISAYGSAARREPEMPFYPLMFKSVTLRMELIYLLTPGRRGAAISDMTKWLAAGALSHPIHMTLPLSEIAAAHELVERGDRVGAVILDCGTT